MTKRNKIIFGVCAWIAQKFDFDVTLVRIAFVLFGLYVGSGIMLYLVLWVVKILSEDN